MKRIAYITSKKGGLLDMLMKYQLYYNKDWIIIVFTNYLRDELVEVCKKYDLQMNIHKDEKMLAYQLEQEDFDIIFLAGYLKVLSKDFVKCFKGKIINLHPANKEYKGKDAHLKMIEDYQKKIINRVGGIIHYVDEGVDTGNIIYEFSIPFSRKECVHKFNKMIKKYSIPLLQKIFDGKNE